MDAARHTVPDNDSLNAAAREWIARMACGDENGMGLLYDGTLDHVYGLALRVTRDQDAAEDVVADTYLQVWRQAGRYDHARGTPLAWLLNITRSRALDYLRRRATAREVDGVVTASALDEPMSEDDPLSLVMALEREQGLRGAIAQLSPTAQRLLGLAFYHGLSHSEIAEQTGLALGTVKSHLRRAQDSLRHLYRE